MRIEIAVSADAADTKQIIEPLVNEAIASLSTEERSVILLRYFEQQSFKDISSLLGITTSAAEKRASRALDRMRRRLTARGATALAAALTVYITENAANASVPLSTDLVTGIACHTASISNLTTIAEGVIRTMSILRAKLITVSTAVVIGAGVSTSVAILAIGRHASAQPAPGVSGPEIAAKCVATYTSLKTFQGTAESGSATASISFTAPNKLIVNGIMLGGGGKYSLLSNSEGTWVALKSGQWTKQPSVTMGIGACTGISGNTAATIPALLTGTTWGSPFPMGTQGVSNTVYTETVNGVATYRLEFHSKVPPSQITQGGDMDFTYWVDQKTFLLVKLHETIVGTSIDENFGPATIDAPIAESTYTTPTAH